MIILIIIIIVIVILIIFVVWWAYETNPQPVIEWWEKKLHGPYHQYSFSHNQEISRGVLHQLEEYSKDIYTECTSLDIHNKLVNIKHLVDWTSLSQNTPSIKKCLYKYRPDLVSCQIVLVSSGKTFTAHRYKHYNKFRLIYSIDPNEQVEHISTEKVFNSTDSTKIVMILEFMQRFPSHFHTSGNKLLHRFLRHNKYNKKVFQKLHKNV